MSPAARPIGVFDSGVGGLTVLRALRRGLPAERLLYFGDTAHVPYGTKSPETVRRLTRAHVRFLVRHGAKCVVVACNTSSAVALDAVAREARVPIVGVIEPGVRLALAATRTGRIGVIGTAVTIASGAYQRRLRAAGRGITVLARACPLFVPLVEAGWARHPVARAVAAEYLAPFRRARVDTLILGCTHYPLLKPALRRILGAGVRLVDSAEAVRREVARVLADLKLRRTRGRGGTGFYLTDTAGSFRSVARRFLAAPLPRVARVALAISLADGVR